MNLTEQISQAEEAAIEGERRRLDDWHAMMVQKEKDREALSRIEAGTDNPDVRLLAEIARRWI